MESSFKPLSYRELKRRTESSFPGVYLTLMSIIEAVALGILLSNTFDYINKAPEWTIWIKFLPYSVICFLTLVIVFYSYSYFVGLFRWSPGIVDIIIPFTLGATQISPMFFLTEPNKWWITMAIFCLVGVGAFCNTLLNRKKAFYEKDFYACNIVKELMFWNIGISAAACFISICGWLFNRLLGPFTSLEIPLLCLLSGTVGLMIYKAERYLVMLYSYYRLER